MKKLIFDKKYSNFDQKLILNKIIFIVLYEVESKSESNCDGNKVEDVECGQQQMSWSTGQLPKGTRTVYKHSEHV